MPPCRELLLAPNPFWNPSAESNCGLTTILPDWSINPHPSSVFTGASICNHGDFGILNWPSSAV